MKTDREMCEACAYEKFEEDSYPCATCNMIGSLCSNFMFKKNNHITWTDFRGNKKKIEDLTDDHICNIVYMFGWQALLESGYQNIVDRFLEIKK